MARLGANSHPKGESRPRLYHPTYKSKLVVHTACIGPRSREAVMTE
jgi:hypothetical protein